MKTSYFIMIIFTLLQITAYAEETPNLRIGVLVHNKGPIAGQTEEGPDINIAYHVPISSNTFSFKGLNSSWHAGAVINTSHYTSYIYAGILGGRYIGKSKWFYEFGGGLAAHDGNLHDTKQTDSKRRMGTRILIRTELSLAYRFKPEFALQFVFDHISNGGLDDDNQGLDTYGLRVIYYF